MDAWELGTSRRRRRRPGGRYHEFLRVPDLSAGPVRARGGRRPTRSRRTPRTSCTSSSTGAGSVTVGDEDRAVEPGSLVFVAAGVPHRFHDITERLELLVVFGPAEGDRA